MSCNDESYDASATQSTFYYTNRLESSCLLIYQCFANYKRAGGGNKCSTLSIIGINTKSVASLKVFDHFLVLAKVLLEIW